MAALERLLTHIMRDNKDQLMKGVKFLAIALPLMILGPVILTIGFRALNDGIYFWLVIGCLLLLAAMFFAFKGIKTILNGLFDQK